MAKTITKPKSLVPPVSIAAKRDLITRLVKPENLRAPGVWPREMKLAHDLCDTYPSEPFWRGMILGFTLNSLAYFKLPQGRETLVNDWAVFSFNFEVDSKDKGSDYTGVGAGTVDKTESLALPVRAPSTVAQLFSGK